MANFHLYWITQLTPKISKKAVGATRSDDVLDAS